MANKNERNNQTNEMFMLAYLENSRMIYDFMEELSDRCSKLNDAVDNAWTYEGYIGKGGLEGRFAAIRKLLGKVKNEIEPCCDEKKLLYQNPLHSFLKFYRKVLEDDLERTEEFYSRMTEMLNYFNILRFLTEPEYKEKRHKEFESLPYIFEDLCFSIKNMTDTRACYIVYKKDGEDPQLVARSGYFVKNGVDNYSVEEYDKFSSLNIGPVQFNKIIIGEPKSDLSIKGIGGVIEIKDKYFLRLELKVKSSENELSDKLDAAKRKFYIILELNEDKEKDKYKAILKRILRVLFLRNRLLDVLKKYYSSLINFRYYCNYVQSMNEKFGTKGNEKIKILHISDLHLDDDESWCVGKGYKWKLFLDKWKKNNSDKGIDLLAVTGDIVNGSFDAASAQRKYKRVADLLLNIAVELWGSSTSDGGNYLPHDWRRRILITTGNHDYDIMNDIEVQTESRKIQAGFPATHSGGTMSKFTYFIEFLTYFLDAPTDKLIRDDLNEIREYPNLNNIIVGIFNTCSKANALQNNKVSFNEERVQAVINDSQWEKSNGQRLILMHHAPDYEIDYFNDKYEMWKYNNIDIGNPKLKIEELYQAFLYSLEYHLTKKNKIYSRGHTLEWLRFVCLFKRIKDCMLSKISKEDVRNILNSKIFSDMQMFYDICMKEHFGNKYMESFFINDYSESFKNTALGLFNIIQEDREKFHYICNEIIKIDNNKVLVLAGHIHRNEPELGKPIPGLDEPKSGLDEPKYSSSIVSKLYDDKKVNYRIIEIKKQ